MLWTHTLWVKSQEEVIKMDRQFFGGTMTYGGFPGYGMGYGGYPGYGGTWYGGYPYHHYHHYGYGGYPYHHHYGYGGYPGFGYRDDFERPLY